jgi:hypothetical protein
VALILTNLHKRNTHVCEPEASYATFHNFF